MAQQGSRVPPPAAIHVGQTPVSVPKLDVGLEEVFAREITKRTYSALLEVIEGMVQERQASGTFNIDDFLRVTSTLLSGVGSTVTDRVKILSAVNAIVNQGKDSGGEDSTNGLNSSVAAEALKNG